MRRYFIKSYQEDGQILSYDDLHNWNENYIEESSVDYFDWLNKQLSKEKQIHTIKEGDIIAFPMVVK